MESGGTEGAVNRNLGSLAECWSTSSMMNTSGINGEYDRSLLRDLILLCVHKKDLNGTKTKLAELLGTGKLRKSVLVRATVYSMLIAVALGLRPGDIKSTKDVQRQYLDRVISEQIKERWGDAHRQGSVLCYLLKDELEKDDDLMTVIYARLDYFKSYPVPYFKGCTPEIIGLISKLWLSRKVLNQRYFNQVIDPIIKKVNHANSDFIISEEVKVDAKKLNFIETKDMLSTQLQIRGAKAGARLLEILIGIMIKECNNVVAGELVKQMFSWPCGTEFKKRFLELKSKYWDLFGKWGYSGTDQVPDGQGQSINVGLLSSHTDYNLLCWAARRGYANLIWCVGQIYQPSPNNDPHYYVHHVLGVNDTWKCALWCATRHGQKEVIHEILALEWIMKGIDFNDYPWGWLPPLHLVALQGNMFLMEDLKKVRESESGANKKDYLGRTPLDYAMDLMSTTKKIKDYFCKPSQKDGRFDKKGQKHVVKKLLHIPGVGERLNELYNMYINQASTVLIGAALIASVAFAGWLQPPLGYADYFQFPQPSPPAPGDTFQSYLAIEGHLEIKMFVVFNTLSFYLAIATMFVGAEATLFVHDKHERTRSLIGMRKSIKWMIFFFISSMLCIMVAFICAGLAILPPIPRLKWSMIVSLIIGGLICMIPLSWILWSLSKNRTLHFRRLHKLDLPEDDDKSLIDPHSYYEKACKELFDRWDADKDGFISSTEVLLKWWEEGALLEVHEVIRTADEDDDGQINYEEFQKMMMYGRPASIGDPASHGKATQFENISLKNLNRISTQGSARETESDNDSEGSFKHRGPLFRRHTMRHYDHLKEPANGGEKLSLTNKEVGLGGLEADPTHILMGSDQTDFPYLASSSSIPENDPGESNQDQSLSLDSTRWSEGEGGREGGRERERCMLISDLKMTFGFLFFIFFA